MQNNLSYNGYSYEPASVNAMDHLKDLFLGTNNVQIKNQNQLNWQMMKEQNKFNEYMSNTSYQRAIQDMEKAGINPMLAALNGGANSPTSASVSQSSTTGTAQAVHKRAKEAQKQMQEMMMNIAKIATALI